MKKYKVTLVIIFVAALFCGGVLLLNQKVFSSPSDNVTGWVWGVAYVDSNANGIQDDDTETDSAHELGGIGWISLNSVNCDPDGDGDYDRIFDGDHDNCPNGGVAPQYGVNIDSSGDLVGYGWSDNYGWVKFGGLSGFPTGSGTISANARINGQGTGSNVDDVVEGWARLCSVYESGCSGTLASSTVSGGWDGWISLGGDVGASSYSIQANTGDGYAWSSDAGWSTWMATLDSVPLPVDGVCSTVQNQCIEGTPDSSPDPDIFPTVSWTCRGQNGGIDSPTCEYTCVSPQVVVNNTCQDPVPPLTSQSYEVSPSIITDPNGTCVLKNWQISGGVTASTTCSVDGSAPIIYTGGDSVSIPIGTHTLTCTDGNSTTTFNTPTRPTCRLNPEYGEF